MRLRIEYGDHNERFGKLLPCAGTVERKVPATDSSLTWYLLKLDDGMHYDGKSIDRLMIASRWPDRSVGGPEPAYVFVPIVPTGTEVGQSFSTTQFAHVAWGTAHALGA